MSRRCGAGSATATRTGGGPSVYSGAEPGLAGYGENVVKEFPFLSGPEQMGNCMRTTRS